MNLFKRMKDKTHLKEVIIYKHLMYSKQLTLNGLTSKRNKGRYKNFIALFSF